MTGDDEKASKKPANDEASSLAARRARLRGSLAKSRLPEELANEYAEPVQPNPVAPIVNQETPVNQLNSDVQLSSNAPSDVVDLLRSLDRNMSACAISLTAVLESLLTTAEQMKTTTGLASSIDQLVAAMQTGETKVESIKVSPDQLVANLADQLSTGIIDPWTFKCAYTAVFPADHPADVLRRLVELLGTQRLSSELFRMAYEAVQTTQPPLRQAQSPKLQVAAGEDSTNIVDDEVLRGELEALRRANEELRAGIDEREEQFEQLLNSKDQELQETQELLNSRYDEFNSRFEEVSNSLNKQEDEYKTLLEDKDMVLEEKESELNMLRMQMEELRVQTQDMVKDLQQQMSRSTNPPAAKETVSQPNKLVATSFFDAPASSPAAASAPSKSFFEKEETLKQPAAVEPQAAPAEKNEQPARTQQPPVANPPTATASGAGSYGSGVRAQVFEVIVRQALAGAPWREICAGPMQVNNISPDEVEAEVKRRQSMLNK